MVIKNFNKLYYTTPGFNTRFPSNQKDRYGFLLSVFSLSMSELTDIFNDNTNLSNKIWEE